MRKNNNQWKSQISYRYNECYLIYTSSFIIIVYNSDRNNFSLPRSSPRSRSSTASENRFSVIIIIHNIIIIQCFSSSFTNFVTISFALVHSLSSHTLKHFFLFLVSSRIHAHDSSRTQVLFILIFSHTHILSLFLSLPLARIADAAADKNSVYSPFLYLLSCILLR